MGSPHQEPWPAVSLSPQSDALTLEPDVRFEPSCPGMFEQLPADNETGYDAVSSLEALSLFRIEIARIAGLFFRMWGDSSMQATRPTG